MGNGEVNKTERTKEAMRKAVIGFLVGLLAGLPAGYVGYRLLTNYQWLKAENSRLATEISATSTFNVELQRRAAQAEADLSAKITEGQAALAKKDAEHRAALAAWDAKAKKSLASVHRFRLPTQGTIDQTGFSFLPENNPFLVRLGYVREVKKSARNLNALWSSLEPMARSFKKWHDDRDLAVGAMLVVAAFYDYGNPTPNDQNGGCVSINQNTGFKSIEVSFDDHMQSDIGCCTDYAALLASFLRHLDIENNPITSDAHQAVRVKIDGRWHYLDANALILAENFFENAPKKIVYFTPYPRTRLFRFQHFLVKALAFGETGYSGGDWAVHSVESHSDGWKMPYLAAQAH